MGSSAGMALKSPVNITTALPAISSISLARALRFLSSLPCLSDQKGIKREENLICNPIPEFGPGYNAGNSSIPNFCCRVLSVAPKARRFGIAAVANV